MIILFSDQNQYMEERNPMAALTEKQKKFALFSYDERFALEFYLNTKQIIFQKSQTRKNLRISYTRADATFSEETEEGR